MVPMENLPRVVWTVVGCLLIAVIYQQISRRILFHQEGRSIEATVTSREIGADFVYVKFTYRAEGRDRTGSFRLPAGYKEAMAVNRRFRVKVVPGRPDEPRFDTGERTLWELEYILMFALAFGVYLSVRANLRTVRPNYD